MKPKFALDLSHEGINLMHRARGGWELVGSLALDDSDMGPHLAELRRKAEALESGGITTKIIIPNSQILYTVLEAPGPDDIAREVQIRSGLDGLTPYPVGELVFDWRADGERARVAVLARETMDEAESFAVEHGFNPVSFVARPASGEFSGEPFFGKTRAATKILGPVERVEPDASPVPRRARAMEPREPSTSQSQESDQGARSAAPTFRPTDRPATSHGGPSGRGPVPEPLDAPAPAPVAPRGSDGDDPFAELDALQAELSGDLSDVSRGQSPSRPARSRRARGRRDGTEGPSAPPLAPFPPTQDEAETDSAKEAGTTASRNATTARRSEPKASDPKAQVTSAPKSEAPAQPAQPQKTRVSTTRFSIDTAPGSEPRPAAADDTAGDETDDTPAAPGVAFSTRRNGNGGTATTATPTVPKGDTAPGAPPAEGQKTSRPPASSAKPAPAQQPPARRGMSDSDRRRAAMADALSRPMPGQDAKPPTTERPRGTFSDVAGVVREAGFRRFGRRTPEPAPPRGPEQPEKPETSLEQLMRDEAKDEARISPLQDDAAPIHEGPPKQDTPPAAAPAPRFTGGDERPEDDRPASASVPEPAIAAPDTAAEATPDTVRADVPAAAPARGVPPPPPPSVGTPPDEVALPSQGKGQRDNRKADRDREAKSLTVFGARTGDDARRTPKYLGVILTLLLLLVMAIIAMWSSLFVGEDEGPQFNPGPAVETAPAAPPSVTEEPPAEAPPVDTAPEMPAAPEETGATPDAGAATPEVLTPEEAETRYAATGVWQRAPEPMAEPRSPQLDVGDIGAPEAPRADAPEPALPEVLDETFATAGRVTPLPPPPPGTVFSLDENGLVVPSPEGTPSPRGYRVFSGPPPIVPPARPGTEQPDDAALAPEQTPPVEAEADPAAEGVAAVEDTAAPAPTSPGDLAGVVAPGPGIPVGAAIDAAVEDAIAASVVGGVGTSIRPNQRPANIDSIVDAALSAAAEAETVVAVPESTTTPAIPTSASVADQATTPDAINLRQINLIGVSGTTNARRALVRMPNGRYVTVRVGDSLDGGQVTSITATGLTYQKGSRSFALEILPLG